VLRLLNRGGVGARSLYVDLQAALDPPGAAKVVRFSWTFSAGDTVMQYNGDVGYVENADEGELRAPFDGRSVTYGFDELDALVPVYAVTIHKSQGLE
jgi:exodeoxyribonuclease V alpha subunit